MRSKVLYSVISIVCTIAIALVLKNIIFEEETEVYTSMSIASVAAGTDEEEVLHTHIWLQLMMIRNTGNTVQCVEGCRILRCICIRIIG